MLIGEVQERLGSPKGVPYGLKGFVDRRLREDGLAVESVRPGHPLVGMEALRQEDLPTVELDLGDREGAVESEQTEGGHARPLRVIDATGVAEERERHARSALIAAVFFDRDGVAGGHGLSKGLRPPQRVWAGGR
jgi:hypothetical protein